MNFRETAAFLMLGFILIMLSSIMNAREPHSKFELKPLVWIFGILGLVLVVLGIIGLLGG